MLCLLLVFMALRWCCKQDCHCTSISLHYDTILYLTCSLPTRKKNILKMLNFRETANFGYSKFDMVLGFCYKNVWDLEWARDPFQWFACNVMKCYHPVCSHSSCTDCNDYHRQLQLLMVGTVMLPHNSSYVGLHWVCVVFVYSFHDYAGFSRCFFFSSTCQGCADY